MDFTTTKATILRWIESCKTFEQLQKCSDEIDTRIIDKFAGKVDVMEFSLAVYELHEAMSKRETELVKSNVILLNLERLLPSEVQAN